MVLVLLAGAAMYFGGASLVARPLASDQGRSSPVQVRKPDAILAARVDTLVESVAPSMRDMAEDLRVSAGKGQEIEGPPADLEWSGFIRTTLHPGSYLATLSPGMTPDALFRNVHLNPSDLYIEPRLREELTVVFSAIESQLRSIEVAHKETALAEAMQLSPYLPNRVERPKRVTVSSDTGAAEMDEYRPRGFQVYLPSEFGGMRVIDQHDLPMTSRVLELKAFTAVEVGEAVVAWFERIGLCPADEALAIRADLHQAANRFVTRREYSVR